MLPPADSRSGLERLARAVAQVEKPPGQKPEGIASRIAFCKLWLPEDTLATFCERYQPRWKRSAVENRLCLIRRLAGFPPRRQIKPWVIAQEYIQQHQHLRYHGDIIPEE